jgi:hypothetical protein
MQSFEDTERVIKRIRQPLLDEIEQNRAATAGHIAMVVERREKPLLEKIERLEKQILELRVRTMNAEMSAERCFRRLKNAEELIEEMPEIGVMDEYLNKRREIFMESKLEPSAGVEFYRYLVESPYEPKLYKTLQMAEKQWGRTLPIKELWIKR